MENSPQFEGGFLTSADPQAEGVGVIELSHYPLPHMYQAAAEETDKQRAGPLVLATTEVLMHMRYGTEFMKFLQMKTGGCLHFMTLGRMAVTVNSMVDDINARDFDSRREVMPLPVMYFSKLFQVVHSYRNADLVMTACCAFLSFLKAVENDPEMVAMMEPLVEPIALLFDADGVISDEALKEWRLCFRRAEYRYAMPITALMLAIQEFGEQAENVVMCPRSQDGSPIITEAPDMPSDAPSASQEASAEEVFAVHEDKFVEHMDGSTGLNVQRELHGLMAFTGEVIDDVGKQFDSSIETVPEGPYREACKLWWRLKQDKVRKDVALDQARLLEATGRVLAKLFEPEEMRILMERLPIEDVVDGVLQYIASYSTADGIPKTSWQQFRIGMLTIPIYKVTALAAVDPVDYTVSLYEDLCRSEEILLARTSIDVQAENMEVFLKRQLEDKPPAVKH